MRKVITSRLFVVAFLALTGLSSISFIVYQVTDNIENSRCCSRTRPEENNRMLWDALSNQFMTTIKVQ